MSIEHKILEDISPVIIKHAIDQYTPSAEGFNPSSTYDLVYEERRLMQDAFSDILSNYLDAKNTPFNHSSRVIGFFKSLVDSLNGLPCITFRPNINIRFSVGQGNWTAIPWVAYT